MPELPEVEVTRLGITPYLVGSKVDSIVVRVPKLRWAIPRQLDQIEGQVIQKVERRAKYLIVSVETGTVLIHLGMSGSLRVLEELVLPKKHDHLDLLLCSGKVLRYNDPRRFGAWLWYGKGEIIPVFQALGPEPLSVEFTYQYAISRSAGKRLTIKQFIMNSKNVVGVGNIYANESLFKSQVHPCRAANSLTPKEWQRLVKKIRSVLTCSIRQGGTTLNNFTRVDGGPGRFNRALKIYGRTGKPCFYCGVTIESKKVGQRSTFFCPRCQPICSS